MSWRRALERRIAGAICTPTGLSPRELKTHAKQIADTVEQASRKRREERLERALRRRKLRQVELDELVAA